MKRKVKQRVIAIMLSVLMVVSLVPVDLLGGVSHVRAEDAYTFDTSLATNVTNNAAKWSGPDSDGWYKLGSSETITQGIFSYVGTGSKIKYQDGGAGFQLDGAVNKSTGQAGIKIDLSDVAAGNYKLDITYASKNNSATTLRVYDSGTDLAGDSSSSANKSTLVSYDKITLQSGKTYILGGSGGMVVKALAVTLIPAAKAVRAALSYSGTEVATVSGSDAGGADDVVVTPTSIVFDSEPVQANLSMAAATGDELGGTYSATVDADNNQIKIFNSNFGSGTTVLATVGYSVAGVLSVMPIGTAAETWDFYTTKTIFGEASLAPGSTKFSANSYIKVETDANGTGVAKADNHGFYAYGNTVFTMIVPPNAMGTLTFTKCQYASITNAKFSADGVAQKSGQSLIASKDQDNETAVFEYKNTTDSNVTLTFETNNATNGLGYIHGISYVVTEIPQLATVTGNVTTSVAGGTLTFTSVAGVDFTTAVGADGSYSIDLPIGTTYTVEVSGVDGWRLDNASVDLTSQAADSTLADQNFTPLFWDTTKTATVTIGGTTYTVKPGASESSDFTVTAAGGDGSVEVVTSKAALVWANLNGKGTGVLTSALVSYGENTTGSFTDNAVTVNFAGTGLPQSFELNVRDNSATGTPARDGKSLSYNFKDGSVVSKLYAKGSAYKLSGGKSTTSNDKFITLTGNTGIYVNDTTHGIAAGANDTFDVKVAGNAEVSFVFCAYGAGTVTASAPIGTVYLSTDATKATTSASTKTETDGGIVAFTYEGDATTLTFALSGGTTYVHSMTIKNEAEPTTVNEGAVSVKPTVLTTLGTAGNLVVTPSGQTLNLKQTGGEITNKTTRSYYAFPEVADFNKLELEIKINSLTSTSDKYGFYIGAFDDAHDFPYVATVAARKYTGLRGIYTKANLNEEGGQINKTMVEGETLKFSVYKAEDGFHVVTTADSFGEVDSTFKYNDNAFQLFTENGSATPVYYGLVLAGVDCDVMNMTYYDKDGNVLYDQNAYYNPIGSAPVATSVTATGAEDRTKITVTWTGDAVVGDGKYVLQVSKDGGEWVEVSDTLTGFSYDYALTSEDSGNYKFRVCGTLGNSDAQSVANRNSFVESNEVTIIAALAAPVITLAYTSPLSGASFSWAASAGATSYEVYRRSSDEAATTLLATVTTTSYVDSTVEAEVPYYYSVKALSDDNFSNPSAEAWTLPTSGHAGEFAYDDAEIAITEKSYDTVFENTVKVSGVVTAPGTVSLIVNGTEKASQDVAEVNGAFSFVGVELNEGRNDVDVVLSYASGAKKTKKGLNFVFLTNYDYVVDDDFTGAAGDTTEYGVPQYKTIGEALTAIGTSNSSQKVVLIREGSYEENLQITTPYASLIGEDSERTVIHYNVGLSRVGDNGGGMKDRCAMYIQSSAKGFSAENLTIQSDWEYKGDGTISNESADAILNEAESTFVNCRILGYQDTLCPNKEKQYYKKCYIAGNVDFIYGNNGQAYFEDCDIVFRYNANKNSGYVTAMKTPENLEYGLVFNNCRITAEEGCTGSKYYLGRPWGAEAAVTYINTYMSGIINADLGFTNWGGKDFQTDLAAFASSRFYECGSYGAGYAVNANRRQISPTKAAAMISVAGLGWNPVSVSGTIGNTYYVGTKATEPNQNTIQKEFNSDKYSWYEGDDTGYAMYDLEGYGQSSSVSGGGLLKEENSNYYRVTTAEEFLTALATVNKNKLPSVIEIAADMNLGSQEVANFSSYSSVITAHTHQAQTHPALIASGVSKLSLKDMTNLTIFSSNGAALKHVALDINGASNIIIRNIVFDELWEWDEETSGDYDVNDWDYVTLQNGSNRIWIDHCTFYKAYDGIVDIKTNVATATNVTVSWCNFLPGSKNNTFFNQMMNTLSGNSAAYPYYKSLLDSGMTKDQIWWYAYGQKKTHLLGQNDNATENVNLHVTFANNYYFDSMDRMPRLRFGNAHVYNCIMDAQELLDARRSITDANAARHIVSNGASSTCDGQLLLENCFINGIEKPLNSGNGSSPSGFINAVNSLYYVDGVATTLEPKANSSADDRTLVLDADAFKGSLPYSGYHLYDPEYIDQILAAGAGAGKMNFTVLQWEKASYNAAFVEPTVVKKVQYQISNDIPATVLTDAVKAATGCTTPEMLVSYLINKIMTDPVARNILPGAYANDNTVMDVVVQVSFDGGVTWEAATAENFPVTGVDIVLPYPEGTSKNGYDFVVGHLIVLGSNGTTPGTLEFLNPAKTDAGLRVHIASASPFVIGWVVTEDDDDDDDDDDVKAGESGTTDASGLVKVIEKVLKPGSSPKTFDQSKFVPKVSEEEIADFAKTQVEKQLEQEAADLLITPQAGRFPFGIVIAALLALAAFIGGEVVYFRRKKQK